MRTPEPEVRLARSSGSACGEDSTWCGGRPVNQAAALWARPGASISAVLEYPDGPRRRVQAELTLDLPADDGTNYEDVDLRYAF